MGAVEAKLSWPFWAHVCCSPGPALGARRLSVDAGHPHIGVVAPKAGSPRVEDVDMSSRTWTAFEAIVRPSPRHRPPPRAAAHAAGVCEQHPSSNPTSSDSPAPRDTPPRPLLLSPPPHAMVSARHAHAPGCCCCCCCTGLEDDDDESSDSSDGMLELRLASDSSDSSDDELMEVLALRSMHRAMLQPPGRRGPSPPPSPAPIDADDDDHDSGDGEGFDGNADDEDDLEEEGVAAGGRPRGRRRGTGALLGDPRHLARRRGERRDPHAVVTVAYLTELYSSPRFHELGPEVRSPWSPFSRPTRRPTPAATRAARRRAPPRLPLVRCADRPCAGMQPSGEAALPPPRPPSPPPSPPSPSPRSPIFTSARLPSPPVPRSPPPPPEDVTACRPPIDRAPECGRVASPRCHRRDRHHRLRLRRRHRLGRRFSPPPSPDPSGAAARCSPPPPRCPPAAASHACPFF